MAHGHVVLEAGYPGGVELVVSDNESEQRFEIWLEGELAGFLQYRRHPRQIAFVHTEVDPRFRGRGLASQLIGSALDTVQAQGLEVIPACPSVRDYIQRHPDYLELVPSARRAHFNLADQQ